MWGVPRRQAACQCVARASFSLLGVIRQDQLTQFAHSPRAATFAQNEIRLPQYLRVCVRHGNSTSHQWEARQIVGVVAQEDSFLWGNGTLGEDLLQSWPFVFNSFFVWNAKFLTAGSHHRVLFP